MLIEVGGLQLEFNLVWLFPSTFTPEPQTALKYHSCSAMITFPLTPKRIIPPFLPQNDNISALKTLDHQVALDHQSWKLRGWTRWNKRVLMFLRITVQKELVIVSPDGKPFSQLTHNSIQVVNHFMFFFLCFGDFLVVYWAVTEEYSKEEQGESGTSTLGIRMSKNFWKHPNLSLRPK